MMDIKITQSTAVKALLWAGVNEGDDDYQIDGSQAWVTVERSDSDEVRISAAVEKGGPEDAGIYVSKQDALQLSALLAAATVERGG
jgi:hypothetical protein